MLNKMTLPYQPLVNHYWSVSHGHVYINEQGIDLRNAVIAIVIKENVAYKLIGKLKVEIYTIMPVWRVRDFDNLNKVILESLTYAKVIEDDKYIDDLRIVRAGFEKNNGHVEIYISELKEAK